MRTWTLIIAAAMALSGSPASAQGEYPNRPVTLVVPLPPGGTTDIMARVIADKLGAALGQTVVVENRVQGGSGTVASRAVARGPADGYTLLLGYTTTLATAPAMLNAGYDVRKDFVPVGLIGMAPALLLVHPSTPYNTAGDLIAAMKAAKEPMQIGIPAVGTVNHLAALLFVEQAGLKAQYIPYKGSGPLTTDMIGGHVKIGFNPIPPVRSALDGKLIRAIAATSAKRPSMLPDLPTLAEAGLPGFDAVLNYGLVVAPATPRPIVEKLNKALLAALATDEVKKRLHQEGADPVPTTPEQHAAIIDQEETKWSRLIKAYGITSP
jgi:tripartite-type tricarboxylate transporter receptor subunit TctC